MFFRKPHQIDLIPTAESGANPIQITMKSTTDAESFYGKISPFKDKYLLSIIDNHIYVSCTSIREVISEMDAFNFLQSCVAVMVPACILPVSNGYRHSYFVMANHSLKRQDFRESSIHILLPHSRSAATLEECEDELLVAATRYMFGEHMIYCLLIGLGDQETTKFELSKSTNASLLELQDPADIQVRDYDFIPEKLRVWFSAQQLP